MEKLCYNNATQITGKTIPLQYCPKIKYTYNTKDCVSARIQAKAVTQRANETRYQFVDICLLLGSNVTAFYFQFLAVEKIQGGDQF